MSRYVVKAMYLEKIKRLTIWNGGSILLLLKEEIIFASIIKKRAGLF
jgi:hypothetical protein